MVRFALKFGVTRRRGTPPTVAYLALASIAAWLLPTLTASGSPSPRTTDPAMWLEQEVSSSTGVYFGQAVALDGTTALIGSPEETVGNNNYQGVVYVYTYTSASNTWTLSQTLTASDGSDNDFFGTSIALVGDTAVIGAPSKTVGGNPYQGAAYVFVRTGGVWAEQQELTANDGDINAMFGTGVGIAGTSALVSAPGATIGPYFNQGAVYVFTQSGTSWNFAQKLTGSNGTYEDFFGISLSVAQDTAVMGTERDFWQGVGEAYVFTESNGTWSESQTLTSSDAESSDGFGEVVATDGTQALIGAPYSHVVGGIEHGGIYAFAGTPGAWMQTDEISFNNVHGLGWAIAMSDNRALVGAIDATTPDAPDGLAFLMQGSGGSWSEVTPFIAGDDNPGYDAYYGYAVALSGTTALIGEYLHQRPFVDGLGAGYFYGPGNVALVASAPQEVNPGDQYTAQAILTNDAATDTPPLSVVMPVPSGAGYVSADATQGSCSEVPYVVTCALGPLSASGGSATANLTLKATGSGGDTITNTAKVAGAAPPLSASAATTIKSSGGGGGGGGGNGGGGGSGGGGGASNPLVLVSLALLMLAALTRQRR